MNVPRVSVLILTRNEASNLATLLPDVARLLDEAKVTYEVVVVDADSRDRTADVARAGGARAVAQERPGYANALRQGFAECRGELVLTLDADLSHRPQFITDLLGAAASADVVIASRYVDGGTADMPITRRILSLVLNRLFSRTLGLSTEDLSSGFRVYRAAVLANVDPKGDYFDVLPEIVALASFAGYRIREIPFHYHPREAGVSKARVIWFGPSYLRTLLRCWRVRRSTRRR